MLVLLSVLLVGGSVFAEVKYQVTDLGAVRATAINNNGKVVGGGYDGGNAFVWDEINGFVSLGEGYARDINDLNDVAGSSYWKQAVAGSGIYSTIALGGNFTANALNDHGQIVGNIGSFDDSHAGLWENGVLMDLGTLHGNGDYYWSYATGVNNSGKIVGTSGVALGNSYTVMWDNQQIYDLGSGDAFGGAGDINESGYACGTYEFQAAIWKGIGDVVVLDKLSGANAENCAYAINKYDVVVGGGTLSLSRDAFVWSQEDGIQNLNDLIDAGGVIELARAYDINDSGQILVEGYIGNEEHSYLLTPVPEPGTVLLLGIGFGFISRLKKR
ncbi:MAG: PEP-CTERM sorting domain-containing protein [Phycisphaerae bacterium]|nr:PEP-CTERM sorting domain-containing protein [Phycisphaerae bacterium]